MKIGDRSINRMHKPYVIAEISGNHAGSLNNAKRLIQAAKKAGADAVKTQCYEARTITLDISKPDFIVQKGLWRQRRLYDLYKRAETPFDWHKELYQTAKDEGIAIFSSVFDPTAVDLLESLGAVAYKIASFEIVDIPLIAYAAQTKKPLIVSTGLASDQEILDARAVVGPSTAFLHCVSSYPCRIQDANLGRMYLLDALLDERFAIGVSDHTKDAFFIPAMSTALGSMLIEKHLALPEVQSEDSAFSLNPDEFGLMVKTVEIAFDAMQSKPVVDEEDPSRQMRRSLYAVADIKKGEQFTTSNIRSIRPGFGMAPKHMGKLLYRTATRSYRKGDPLREPV